MSGLSRLRRGGRPAPLEQPAARPELLLERAVSCRRAIGAWCSTMSSMETVLTRAFGQALPRMVGASIVKDVPSTPWLYRSVEDSLPYVASIRVIAPIQTIIRLASVLHHARAVR